MRRSSISSQGSSSSTGASIELSRFVNGPSFIGRELARRIVLMSTILGPGSDGAAENDAWSGVVMSLLGHSCTVRFFRWVESTYVPQYLSSAYSGLRSSQLEADGTMRSMMSMSSLSAACRDLFYIRQLLCEIFVLFFRVSERAGSSSGMLMTSSGAWCQLLCPRRDIIGTCLITASWSTLVVFTFVVIHSDLEFYCEEAHSCILSVARIMSIFLV